VTERDSLAALRWIVDVLHRHQVPFQITGGCAAKTYGSTRELNDIDIDIPRKDFKKILTAVKPYITFGPQRYKDGKWDVYLMTLNYIGQEIDIGSAEFKVST